MKASKTKRKPNASKENENKKSKQSRMGASSRNKGRVYENEFCEELKALGIASQRIPMSGAAGGRFASDVMVWPNAITSFTVEVKFRSSPSGFVKLLKGWDALDNQPAKIHGTELLLMKLEDFPKGLETPPGKLQELKVGVPSLLTNWMTQAQESFGFLAIRFPARLVPYKWLIVLDATSQNLLRTVTYDSSQLLSMKPGVTPR